ncbi:hypothetical protein D3C76_1073900 [compost metagenome]
MAHPYGMLVRVQLHQGQLRIRGSVHVVYLPDHRMQPRIQHGHGQTGGVQQLKAFNGIKSKTGKSLVQEAFSAHSLKGNIRRSAPLLKKHRGPLSHKGMARHGIHHLLVPFIRQPEQLSCNGFIHILKAGPGFINMVKAAAGDALFL